ncbi:hypothetical protein [Cupriavidus basilensis]
MTTQHPATNDLRVALHTPASAVVVTGGASGIGEACAAALAAVGRPVAIWDIQEEKRAPPLPRWPTATAWRPSDSASTCATPPA